MTTAPPRGSGSTSAMASPDDNRSVTTEPGEPPTPQEPPFLDPFAHPEAMRPPLDVRYSRWAKSETTMGPFGRVATSLALLVPLLLFFYAGIMGLVGAAMWVFIVMPAALRSIWKRARVIEDD